MSQQRAIVRGIVSAVLAFAFLVFLSFGVDPFPEATHKRQLLEERIALLEKDLSAAQKQVRPHCVCRRYCLARHALSPSPCAELGRVVYVPLHSCPIILPVTDSVYLKPHQTSSTSHLSSPPKHHTMVEGRCRTTSDGNSFVLSLFLPPLPLHHIVESQPSCALCCRVCSSACRCLSQVCANPLSFICMCCRIQNLVDNFGYIFPLYNVSIEVIFVEWDPPSDMPSLASGKNVFMSISRDFLLAYITPMANATDALYPLL